MIKYNAFVYDKNYLILMLLISQVLENQFWLKIRHLCVTIMVIALSICNKIKTFTFSFIAIQILEIGM